MKKWWRLTEVEKHLSVTAFAALIEIVMLLTIAYILVRHIF